jgi:hypothetical protein
MLLKEGLAQDVEQAFKDSKNILKEDPVSVTGSIGANAVFYQPYGIAPRRDPFYWVLNANLNISLFNKVSVPFSAVITQQDKNYSNGLDKFSQPFNQFGISPKYRWLTVHAGFRSLEFSEYTLSGAMFLGGGVEIKPEKSLVSGSGFYGRFVKAVPQGGVDGVVVSLPAYERWGGGAKIKLGTENNYGEFIFLKIRDQKNSLAFDTALTVTPQENQILSVGTKQKINRWLSASADLAYSMYSKNLYEEIYKLERFTYVNQIYSPRPSSQFNKAMNAGLEFSPGKYRLGIKYKRIDPDYKTLGSIFLTNDVEELSLNTAFAVLKNKISVTAASGVQQNNLDKNQLVTSRRVIGSLNLSYNITSHLNISAHYSNFSSNTLPVRDVFTDSIKFVQLTQNGGLAASYAFGKKKLKHTLNNNSTYQESGSNKQGLTTFFNETFSYNIFLEEFGLGLNLSALYNKATNAGQGINEGYGPNLGLQKSFFKSKIRLQLSVGFQNTYLDKKALNKNQSYNFTLSYTIDKHQSLKINCSYLDKKAIARNAQQFSEVRGSVGYIYNFGIKSNKIKTNS